MNIVAQASRIGGKALALNIFPAPTSLAESREILRVLKSYGGVQTYKLFKYDKYNYAENRGLVIFKEEEYADEFRKACPLYLTLERVLRDEDQPPTPSPESSPSSEFSNTMAESQAPDNPTLLDDTSKHPPAPSPPPSTPTPPAIATPESSEDAPELTSPPTLLYQPTPPPEPKFPVRKPPPMPFEPAPAAPTTTIQFRLTATPWLGSHRDYLAGTKFWGPFIAARSPVQEDLLRRLGQGLAQRGGGTGNMGLSDVDVWGSREVVPERIRGRRLEAGWKGTLRAVLSVQGREGVGRGGE